MERVSTAQQWEIKNRLLTTDRVPALRSQRRGSFSVMKLDLSGMFILDR